jgi:hypothetical protein
MPSHYSNETYPRSLLQPVTLHSTSFLPHLYSHNCQFSILYKPTFLPTCTTTTLTMTDHHGKATTGSAVNVRPPSDTERRHGTDYCAIAHTSVNRDNVSK